MNFKHNMEIMRAARKKRRSLLSAVSELDDEVVDTMCDVLMEATTRRAVTKDISDCLPEDLIYLVADVGLCDYLHAMISEKSRRKL